MHFANFSETIADFEQLSASQGMQSTSDDCIGSSPVQRYVNASKKLSQTLRALSEETDDNEVRLFINNSDTCMLKSTAEPLTHNADDIESPCFTNGIIDQGEDTFWEWTASVPAASFSTKGQVRRGSAHGRGGRLPGSGAQVRKHYSRYARIVIYKHLHQLLTMESQNIDSDRDNRDTINTNIGMRALCVAQNLVQAVASLHGWSVSNHDDHSPHHVQGKLLSELEQFSGLKVPNSIEPLPCCIMGVTARFTKSDFVEPTTSTVFNARERHVIATWVDDKGGIRCSCVGNTQYDIFALNGEFGNGCCAHSKAFAEILKELANNMFGTPEIPLRILHEGFAAVHKEFIDGIMPQLPTFRIAHRGKTIILVGNDTINGGQIQWVPIRIVQRSGGRPLCAFCDIVDSNHCHHVTAFRKYCGQETQQPTNSSALNQNDNDVEFAESGNNNQVDGSPSRVSNHQPISTLPLSPVNCPRALRVDQEVSDLLKTDGVFQINAPLTCTHCDGPRIENTRETNTSGVIMCSLGACGMEVETYVCSGCKRRFSAEGRTEGVFIDSICMAATHKLLRDQLIGFALGNGTLSSRLSQFHSQVSAFEDASIFKSQLSSRSTRKLYDLCVYFLRLMVRQPPVKLFTCSTCQVKVSESVGPDDSRRGLRAVCVDGIWAGYQKKSVVPFQNVSQPCVPPTFSRSTRSLFRKPRTSFLRLDRTVTYMLNAIKGKTIEVSQNSIPALVGAIRIASETALPANFYQSSVCGSFQNDYSNDIGDGCLKKVRILTTSLFHRDTILYRLLEPLQKVFQRQAKRRKTQSHLERNTNNSAAYDVVTGAIFNLSHSIHNDGGVAWNNALRSMAARADFGRKLLLMYTSIIQGPLTHLITRNSIRSAEDLATACIVYEPEVFLKQMTEKNFSSVLQDSKKLAQDQDILRNLRIFAAGLCSAAAADKISSNQPDRIAILPLFGKVLLEAVRLVESFHSFYEKYVLTGDASAAKYAVDWKSRDFCELREKFTKISASEEFQPSWGVDYDDPFTTGAYFPSLPQVRPLPFNDQQDKGSEEDTFGFCSKHYLQRNASFTPGALTFSCSCSHPKVLGFKVLERDEGPRAVLDVLVSRFSSLPPFVIYDFACGVYKSAVNSLWWVVESSTLVSDPFHANNHTCSPAFVPIAHVKLNMLNTVSHEQRNRPIARIKGSLQQTRQDVYISLLAYQIIINNIEAKGRRAEDQQVPVPNRSAKDIEWSFFHRLHMRCYCCTLLQKETIVDNEKVDSDMI